MENSCMCVCMLTWDRLWVCDGCLFRVRGAAGGDKQIDRQMYARPAGACLPKTVETTSSTWPPCHWSIEWFVCHPIIGTHHRLLMLPSFFLSQSPHPSNTQTCVFVQISLARQCSKKDAKAIELKAKSWNHATINANCFTFTCMYIHLLIPLTDSLTIKSSFLGPIPCFSMLQYSPMFLFSRAYTVKVH